MRVTTAGQTTVIIQRLLDSQRKLSDAQQRAASGLKVEKMSDDPTAGSSIMQTSTSLRGIEQYTRNVEGVQSRLDAEDSALSQLSDLLSRARELSVANTGSNSTAATRKAAASEVRALYDQAALLGNQKLGDDYLFGGTNVAAQAPFATFANVGAPPVAGGDPRVAALDGNGNPIVPAGERLVEVAAGQTIRGVHDGTAVFASSGALKGLWQLATALENDDTAGITTAQQTLTDGHANVQAWVGDLGARQNQADAVKSSLEALNASATQYKSDLSEVDMEQAITEMLARQTAYQSAMLASSKVMGMSLTQYLR